MHSFLPEKSKNNKQEYYLICPSAVDLEGFLNKNNVKPEVIKHKPYPIRRLGRKQLFYTIEIHESNQGVFSEIFDRYWEDFMDANGFC